MPRSAITDHDGPPPAHRPQRRDQARVPGDAEPAPLIHDLPRRLVGVRAELRVVANTLVVAHIPAAAKSPSGPQPHSGRQVTLISGTLGPADTLLGTLATAAELHAGIRNDYRDSDEHCHARRKIVHAVA